MRWILGYRFIATLRLVILLALALGGSPALASNYPGGDSQSRLLQPVASDVQGDDLASLLAAHLGVPVDDASAFLEAQVTFSELVQALSQDHPDSFASSRVLSEPFGFELVFVGGPPEKLPDTVEGFPLSVSEAGQVPAKTLESLRRHIYLELVKTGRADGTTTALDLQSGSVLVSVPQGLEIAPSENLADLLSDPRVNLDSRGLPLMPSMVDQAVRGGARTRFNGDPWCTTAFSVENSSGVGGILPADHCNAERYVHPEDGTTLALDRRGQHTGQWGDVEWYATDETEKAEFYAGDLIPILDVTSVRGASGFSYDDTIGYYGRTSGVGWSNVLYTSGSCGGVDALVIMQTPPTQGGDSGAPWFNGGQAAGIHKGLCFIDGAYRSIFSKAARVDEALGVTIRKKP